MFIVCVDVSFAVPFLPHNCAVNKAEDDETEVRQANLSMILSVKAARQLKIIMCSFLHTNINYVIDGIVTSAPSRTSKQ